MKTKTMAWVLGVLLGGSLLALLAINLTHPSTARKFRYTQTKLIQGDIEATISSTGKLEAINTVQVGTQLSGTIKKIYVVHNSQVYQGQLLAEMDTAPLVAALHQAQASVSVADAQWQQKQEDLDRNQLLFERDVISEKEYSDSKHACEQAMSNLKMAEAALESAELNLGYTRIRSPIAGTVTERSVEEGQTVAAAFATPILFVIAEDLSKMRVLADVDESDIGDIRGGMLARFRVQPYPERTFDGVVSQIRLQPAEVDNVVNYTVVVDVANRSRLLLPGMTTDIDFISDRAEKALIVNNSALRFIPDERMLRELKPVLMEKVRTLPDSLQYLFLTAWENETNYTPENFRKMFPKQIGGLFYQDKQRRIDFDFVKLGIVTGQQSEVVSFLSGTRLSPGTEIINGID